MKERILSALLTSFFMVVAMSFAMTLINVGFTKEFLFVYLRSVAISYCIAFPVSFFVVPLVRKIVNRTCRKEED